MLYGWMVGWMSPRSAGTSAVVQAQGRSRFSLSPRKRNEAAAPTTAVASVTDGRTRRRDGHR